MSYVSPSFRALPAAGGPFIAGLKFNSCGNKRTLNAALHFF